MAMKLISIYIVYFLLLTWYLLKSKWYFDFPFLLPSALLSSARYATLKAKIISVQNEKSMRFQRVTMAKSFDNPFSAPTQDGIESFICKWHFRPYQIKLILIYYPLTVSEILFPLFVVFYSHIFLDWSWKTTRLLLLILNIF